MWPNKLLQPNVEESCDTSDNAVLEKAEEERLQIIAKYSEGEDHQTEENWENSFVYKVTDRYGFIHEKQLPENLNQEEMDANQLEIKRQQKWLKMIAKGPNLMFLPKFHSRVYKGIPLSVRGNVWMIMLDVADLKKKNRNMYNEMKDRALKKSYDIKQIDVDVNRTFRNHIMFRNRYCIKQQQLFYVLAAYSVYNSEVGYCQGMSQIAALFLMFMDEEDAFWALHSLMLKENHSMHGFFKPGFPKLFRFQEHHDKLLNKFLPVLKMHLEKLGIPSSLYTLKWFFQCFLERAPFSLALRIWDIYLLEGERILIAMAFTTLKVHADVLLKLSMEKVAHYFQHDLAVDFGYPDDTIIEFLKANMMELKVQNLDLPPPPSVDEAPKLVPGSDFEPTVEQKLGLRTTLILDIANKEMTQLNTQADKTKYESTKSFLSLIKLQTTKKSSKRNSKEKSKFRLFGLFKIPRRHSSVTPESEKKPEKVYEKKSEEYLPVKKTSCLLPPSSPEVVTVTENDYFVTGNESLMSVVDVNNCNDFPAPSSRSSISGLHQTKLSSSPHVSTGYKKMLSVNRNSTVLSTDDDVDTKLWNANVESFFMTFHPSLVKERVQSLFYSDKSQPTTSSVGPSTSFHNQPVVE